MLHLIGKALLTSFSMFWEVFWPLALGFALSAIIQALVHPEKISRLLGKVSIKSVGLATFFGAVSSSCSYAAVALARTLFKKGSTLLNAMVFEIASTNLVIELGIVLWILLGWQFVLAEFVGGFIMIAILYLVFRTTLTKTLEEAALAQARKGLVGKMEGHATMDMSVAIGGSFLSRLFSKKGFIATSHYYVMDWTSVLWDIVLGFILAGALATFVPNKLWETFFFSNNPALSKIVGPLVGPLVAVVSFVCSVGNIPLAAVLWNGGISFGGVISFIYADLIILPILNIYRKYYGLKPTLYILITFYFTMAAAGYITEVLFSVFGLVPKEHTVKAITETVQFNYTSMLNVLFFIVSGVLLVTFIKTKGLEMLKMMDQPMEENHHH